MMIRIILDVVNDIKLGIEGKYGWFKVMVSVYFLLLSYEVIKLGGCCGFMFLLL